MKNILLVLISFLIIGCMTSTPYQPMGFKGGYENTQLDKNVFEVTFSGNGLTSSQRVRDFAMLRSAELTIQIRTLTPQRTPKWILSFIISIS